MSESKSKAKKTTSPIEIKTVDDMKKALEQLEDSAIINADYTFKIKELENLALEEPDPEEEIYQEFSLTLDNSSANDIVIFKLKLENESIWF